MAVKVKIKKKKPTRVQFTAADFAHPDERRARLVGISAGAGVTLAILGLLALTPWRLQLMTVWLVWSLLALFYFYLGADGAELRELTRGAGGPRDSLSAIVNRQARMAGVSAEAAVSASAPEFMTVRNAIVAPRDLLERLGQAELWGLTAREIGHITAGHVGLLGLCRRVEEERRALYRILALPLRAMVRALANWRWYAAMTADQMAMVLTRDRRVLAAALLKQATAGVEGVSAAEIDEYLSRSGEITAQSADVTTYFKLGEVLRGREGLMMRLRAMGQYAESEEYRQACARLDAAHGRSRRGEAASGGPPGAAPPADAGPSGPPAAGER